MKDFFIFLAISILYLSFKSTILPTVPAPDIPLIIVFFMAYNSKSTRGVALSFIVGYLDDVLNGSIIGTTSFTLVFIYAAGHLLARKMHFSNLSSKVIGCAVASLIKGILSYIIWRSVSHEVSFFAHVIPTMIITALFAPFVISIFEKFPTLSGADTTEGGIS
ncbi:MAG: rod shape-determining protein MreD [Thermodesulfobacteriota bacterium]